VRQSSGRPARAGQRGPDVDKRDPVADDARQRILDAAETQFAQDGYDATPTARIAEQAGVPKGLLFYYFPKKIDVLRTLLAERLPAAPLCGLGGIVRNGDLPGSLLRLARKLGLGQHESVVLRTIIFREAGTHPEVGEHIRALREGLLDLTEAVLDLAAPLTLDPSRRRQAAQTYVAVMLDEANARRFDGPVPDLEGAARIVSAGLIATA
jgi:AcrR family transcriptional regulator